ncbi:hypothetical protein [Streptomyces sp. NPDC048436]
MSDRNKDVETLALRHQFVILERQLGTKRTTFTAQSRAPLVVS